MAGEVRIKINQVGVCGTDLHIHHGEFQAKFPLIPGHELVGNIDAVGEGVDRFTLGEQVTVNPNIYCGHCDYCLAGRLILLREPQGHGQQFPRVFRRVRHRSRDPGVFGGGIGPGRRGVLRTGGVRDARPGNPAGPPRRFRPGVRCRSDRSSAGTVDRLRRSVVGDGGSAHPIQAGHRQAAGHRHRRADRPERQRGQRREAESGFPDRRWLRLHRRGHRFPRHRRHLRPVRPATAAPSWSTGSPRARTS